MRAPRRVINRPEEELQKVVVAFLDRALPVIDGGGVLWFHVPNQRGTRSRWENQLLKALGVRAGLPDLGFLPLGRPSDWIELKAGRNKPTAEQKDVHERLRALGCRVAVCYSLEDVERTLRAWGYTLRATCIAA
jgi:hypothetical protein